MSFYKSAQAPQGASVGPGSSPMNQQTLPAQQQAQSGGVGGMTVPTAGMPGATPVPTVTPPQLAQASPVMGARSGVAGQAGTFTPAKTAMARPEFLIPDVSKIAGISQDKRESLSSKQFAVPISKAKKIGVAGEVKGEAKGKYPVDTLKRARNALARVSQFGTPSERAAVRSKVYSKYPNLKEGFEETHGESPTSKENIKKVEQGGIGKIAQQQGMLGGFGMYGMMHGVDPASLRYAIHQRLKKTDDKLKRKREKKAEIEKTSEDIRMLSPDYAERVGGIQQKVAPHVVGGALGAPLAVLGGAAGDVLRKSPSKLPIAAGALLGGAAGYGLGRLQWDRVAGKRDFAKGERRAALSAIREAKRQGYNPILVNKRSEAEFDKVREVLRNRKKAVKEHGLAGPSFSKESMATANLCMKEFLAIAEHASQMEKEAWSTKLLQPKYMGQEPGRVLKAVQRMASKVGYKEKPYVKKFSGPGAISALGTLKRKAALKPRNLHEELLGPGYTAGRKALAGA